MASQMQIAEEHTRTGDDRKGLRARTYSEHEGIFCRSNIHILTRTAPFEKINITMIILLKVDGSLDLVISS